MTTGTPSLLTAGIATGSVATIASLQPLMLQRKGWQQAALSGASFGVGMAAGVATAAGTDELDKHSPLTPLQDRLALAGISLGTILATHHATSTGVQMARSAALGVGTASTLGAGIIGANTLASGAAKKVRGTTASTSPAGTATKFGVLGAIAGSAALGTWYVLAHRPQLAAQDMFAAERAMANVGEKSTAFDADRYAQIVADRAAVTTRSGSADSAFPLQSGNREQSRFLAQITPASEITRVMGSDTAIPARDPGRIYLTMDESKTPAQLAQTLSQEIDRVSTTATQRDGEPYSRIHVYQSTGTGFVDPIVPEANEYMSRGDVLSIGIQYNNKPSVLSLNKVKRAAAIHDASMRMIQRKVAAMPADKRPSVGVFGESLGALTIQDSWGTDGVDALAKRGIDHALMAGTPGLSKWKPNVLAGRATEATGTVAEFASPKDLAATPAAQRNKLSVHLLTHYHDPVAKFQPGDFARPITVPSDDRPTGIAPKSSFVPGVTGLQLVLDTLNATHIVPGKFGRLGHDYRADLTPFVKDAFKHTNVTDAQQSAIHARLVQSELARADHPAWTMMPAPTPSANHVGIPSDE